MEKNRANFVVLGIVVAVVILNTLLWSGVISPSDIMDLFK